MVVLVIFFALFVAMGFVFLSGRGLPLISGYNTASDSEKEKIDGKKLCKFMAGLMFVLAACWLVVIVGVAIGIKQVMWFGIFLSIVATLVWVVLANTGNRFGK